MARIRTIKPEFWEDESIGNLSHAARLLFLGSLNLADDEGLLRWNAMYLGSAIFPYDDIKSETVSKWMQELIDNELVFTYKSNKVNIQVGLIVSFHKHQRIDKPQPAKFPPPNYHDVRLKRLISKRDGHRCHICGGAIIENDSIKQVGSKALSLDHVIPQSKGGTDYPSNLKASHLSCNHRKAGKQINSINYSENDSENDSENFIESIPSPKGMEGNGRERKGNGKEGSNAREAPDDSSLKISLPFESENFKNQWVLWKDYKSRDHKFKFKSPQSEQAALKELVQIAGGSEETAVAVIHQSMANGWKGFFELKISQNGIGKNAKQSTGREGSTASAFAKIDQLTADDRGR